MIHPGIGHLSTRVESLWKFNVQHSALRSYKWVRKVVVQESCILERVHSCPTSFDRRDSSIFSFSFYHAITTNPAQLASLPLLGR